LILEGTHVMSLFLSNPQLNPAGLELPFTLLVLVSFSDPWLPLPAQYNTGMTDRHNFPK